MLTLPLLTATDRHRPGSLTTAWSGQSRHTGNRRIQSEQFDKSTHAYLRNHPHDERREHVRRPHSLPRPLLTCAPLSPRLHTAPGPR